MFFSTRLPGKGIAMIQGPSGIPNEDVVRIPARRLKEFTMKILREVDVPENGAEITTDCLIEADLRGVYSHGVMRLPVYVRHLKKTGPGGMTASPEISVIREGEAYALVDGGNGLGPVVSARAMQIAIEKAKAGALASVGVRNSNHNGAEAYYAMMALEHEMIGFCVTVGGKNIIAPWGGLTALLGNNPFAFAIPAGAERPVVLDMACSVVARGWIMLAMKNNWKIPDGWAVNREGEPTTDAEEAYEGLVLPVGEYKGYALALMGCILGGVLTGASIGSEVTDLGQDFDRGQNVGHFVGALSIEKFIPVQTFKERMDRLIKELKSSRRMKGVEKIYLPGEKEYETREQNLRDGIPISRGVLSELNALGTARLEE